MLSPHQLVNKFEDVHYLLFNSKKHYLNKAALLKDAQDRLEQ